MFFLGISYVSFSQQKSDFWDNVRFGGGFTLGFGSQTTVGISPSAIYDFNKAITLDPKIGIYYHNKGLAHHLINEDIEACKCWKMADELGYSESSNYIKKYCSIDIIM